MPLHIYPYSNINTDPSTLIRTPLFCLVYFRLEKRAHIVLYALYESYIYIYIYRYVPYTCILTKKQIWLKN